MQKVLIQFNVLRQVVGLTQLGHFDAVLKTPSQR